MKLLRLALAILLVWFVVPSTAAAHSGVQSYVYVSVFDDGLEGRVEYPIADLSAVIGVELPDDASTITDLSDDVRGTIIDYTGDHLAMSGDEEWTLEFDGTIGYLPTESGGYVLVPFEVVDGVDEVPREWTVTFDGVIEANPERDALFLIEDDWQSATFRNEGEHLLGFSVGNETQVVDLETVSTFESLREIARRGSVAVDRSAIALAAIATLVATAALVSRPSGSSGPAWRWMLAGIGARVGLVVVGQSVSLWVIGFAGVDVGVRVAMFAGALAVLVAAASRWTSGAGAHAAAVVVGGLVGVVIGGEFVRQELHRSRPVRSLLAFDVGASATVVFAAALLVPLLLLVGRSRFAARAGMAVGALATVAGAIWLVESSLDVTFPLRTLELHVADAVTSPLIVGIATVIVGVAVLTGSTRTPPESHAPAADDESTPGPSERIEVR